MTPTTTSLRIERAGTTLALELDRPGKMNALDAPLVEALLEVVTRAYTDGTRVLVLRGNGRNFSAGFDLSDLERASEGDLLLRFVRVEELLQAVHHAPYETIAIAHGRNFGAGVDLVCACARRIADPDTTFRMPGLQFGLVLGTRRFANRVGRARARTILQTSATFNASQALEMGFCERVAPRDTWREIAEAIAGPAGALSSEAAAALHRCTTTDSRTQDMVELVRSACAPGLKDRIRAYRSTQRPGS